MLTNKRERQHGPSNTNSRFFHLPVQVAHSICSSGVFSGDGALTTQAAAVRLNPPSAELRVRRFTVKLWQTSNCILTTRRSIMNSLRIARAAVRARPAAIARPIQRRGYAEVASDKIKLSLALPHQVRIARGWHT
jgi:hypothetical protein